MENDTIRGSGANTLVDVWIDGKMRGICVSRGAIEAYLGLSAERSAAMTEEERCEFVRTHLAPIMKVASNKLRDLGGGADSVVIEAGQLGGGERRKVERRKTDRRKAESKVAGPGDRRRGDRRKGERRARKPT